MRSVTLPRWAVLGLLSLFALVARAETVGITVTATGLTRASGAALPDNSLIQVIANTAGQTPGAPTVSSFATGSDLVLASFGLNSATTGIAGSFQIYLTIDRSAFTGLNPGAPLLLRWYDLAYASGQSAPGSAVYGQFTTSSVVDGSTSGWTLGSDGSHAALNFIAVANGGSQAATAGKTAFVVAPPTVTALAPTFGAATGNTAVTLTGTNFTGATAVTFGANAGTNLTVVSDTSITVTSPAGAGGTVDVTVTTANGTSATSASDQFTYIVAPTIATAPQTQTVAGMGNTTLTVVAGGTGPFTYQWYFGGSPLTGQTGASLSLSSVLAANAGAYTVAVTNTVGSVTSDPATLTVGPYITALSADSSVGLGGTQTFSVTAAGSGTLTYQWRKDTTPIAGATNATYVVDPVTVADAGSYNVVVSGSGTSATSGNSVLTVLPNPIVSTATTSIADANGVSAFLAIEGTATKKIVLAAYGPALTSVTGAIADPQIEVLDATGASVATNNDWGTISDGTYAATYARLGLTPLATGSKDAVIYTTLAAGTYRVRVTGVGGATGAVRLALGDADLNPASRVAYFAVRGPLSTSSPMTGGFAMTSPAARNLLFRAIGPSLGAAGHVDPVLAVYDTDGTSVLFNNDNWGGGGPLSTAFAQAGAFALASDSKDSAAVAATRFGTGAYTTQITAASGTGDVLWEVYDPNGSTPASFAPIVVLPPASQNFGTSSVTLTAVAVGGGTLAYQWKKGATPIDGATSATYTLASPTASDAGTYTVTVTNAAGTATASATLKALPIVNSATASSGTYGKPFSFAVTASAAPTGYSATNLPAGLSINPTTGEISGTPTTIGVTTATVTATNADGTGSGSLQITVGKRSLVVTPDSGQTKVYGNTNPTITYTVGGDGLTGSDALTGALTRDAGENVGSYAIAQGTLAASGNYELSVASGTFGITARPISVTANSGQSKIYSNTDPTLAYTVGGSGLASGDSLSGALTRDTGENVGTYAITQGTLSAGANYNLSFTGATFSITPRAITVAANSGQSKTYGNADPTLTYAVGGSGLASSDTLNGALTRDAGENVGTYAITQGTLSAGSNYNLSFTGATFAITPRAITVAATSGQSKTYGNVDPTLTYTIGSSGLASGDSLSGALTRDAGENVGTYAIAQGTLSAGANYNLSFTGAAFAITTRPIAVAADSGQTKVYGSNDPLAFTYRITSGSLVSGDAFTGALTRAPGANVGGYAIDQGTLTAGGNYALTYTGASFTITAKPITITANSGQAKTYGAADPATFTTSVAPGALVSGDTLPGAATRAPGEAAGAYAINQGTLSAGANYAVTFVPADFTIDKAVLTVTADNLSRPYGAANPTLTSAIAGFVGTDNLANAVTGAPDLTTTATATSPQGDYPIAVALHTLAAANYRFALVDGTLTVTKAELVVTAEAKTKIYGTANPVATYTITGFLGTDTATVVTGAPALTHAATTASPVGSYGIAVAMGTLATNNYTFKLVDGQLAVTKATLTVTADPQTKVYGAAVPDTATFTATLSGFANGETLATSGVTGAAAVTTGVTAASGVAGSPYPLTAALGTLASANYDFTFAPGAYAITPAPLTITADAQTKIYGAAVPPLTATLTGFVNGETLATSGVTGLAALTSSATVASAVGAYAITPTAGTLAAANYAFTTFAPSTLDVTKATLLVTADSKSMAYGAAVPALTATITGLVNGDTVASAVSGSASLGSGASSATGVGSYPITAAVGTLSAANYTFNFAPGTLAIAAASATITLGNLSQPYDGRPKQATVAVSPAGVGVSVTYSSNPVIGVGSYAFTATVTDPNYFGSASGTLTITNGAQTVAIVAPATATLGTPVSVSASASSGLPVTLSASGPATLSGGQLTFNGPGTVTLTATQAGNQNYASASATATVTVAGRLAQTIAFAGIGDRLSNSGSVALEATASSGLPVSFVIVGGPAMLSGNVVTLTGAAGRVLIRASQAGNTLYDPAPDVTTAFTVTAATLNVFFGTLTNSGSTAKSGDVAATLPPASKQGTLLVVAPAVGINTVLDFTLNDNGTFTQTIVVNASDLGIGVGAADSHARAAAPVTLTLRGSLVNGILSGVIEPLGLNFNANVLPVAGPSANAAGFYKSSTLANTNGATYTVVGTNNQVLVLAATPDVTTGGLTTLNANGTFGLQTQTTAGAATITGAVDEPTTTVEGKISLPGKPDASFAGLVVTTTRTDRLINLSSRVSIGSGDRVLITGFVIGGNESKQVLIRGVGPALAGFGVQGTLANPRIRIYRGSELVAENDDWSTAANAGALASVFGRLGAFSLANDSADAALLATLPPGAYTAQVIDGATGTTAGAGVALAEIYDASTNPNADYQRLVNISTRGVAGTGENVLIGGFVVTGNSPKKLLIRGIGPGLAAFGVAGTLADPRLGIYQGATLVAENDNWSTSPDSDAAALTAAMRDTGAFALPAGSRDAAIILTLAPGSYTAQVGAADGVSSGIALVEIYEIPQ